jgi:hypothetical protein
LEIASCFCHYVFVVRTQKMAAAAETFVADSDDWRQCMQVSQIISEGRFRVITWNVWFDNAWAGARFVLRE